MECAIAWERSVRGVRINKLFILEIRSADEVNNMSRMIEISHIDLSMSCNLALSASLSAFKLPSICIIPHSVFSICDVLMC